MIQSIVEKLEHYNIYNLKRIHRVLKFFKDLFKNNISIKEMGIEYVIQY
ncbi:hypothetical protein LCGC14_1991200 [marine sediment metagenome]|uniref:Uncharacterized protein n=1 Tax=marine sediment metagenome TaxID=412755 RepID=A0A0F9I364_9ZZZZ